MILRMKKKFRKKNKGNSQNLPQKLEPKVLTKSENRPEIVETLWCAQKQAKILVGIPCRVIWSLV